MSAEKGVPVRRAPPVGSEVPGEAELYRERAARRKLRRMRAVECKLQMTSMIDIVFLLIIFLIVVTDLSQTEIEAVELPYAVEAEPDDEPELTRVVVNVDQDGRMSIWGRPYDEERLLVYLRAKAAVGPRDRNGLPAFKVKIRADRRVAYRHVQNAMVQCMRARVWRVSFGARPVDDDEETGIVF